MLYVLALKRNRPEWHSEAKALFAAATPDTAEAQTQAHGRSEWRQAAVIAAPVPRTSGHAGYGRIISRRNGGPPKTRYVLLSRVLDPAVLLRMMRGHWRIETSLHWVLDVHLGEDMSRARRDHAPANTALLKRLARNILELADKPGVPISHRIRKCQWSDDYLIAALSHMR